MVRLARLLVLTSATLLVFEPVKSVEVAPEESVGVDVGLESFATLSTGQQVACPRFLRKGEADLKKAHHRVSRRVKGSKRRKKAVRLPAKKHQHVARQRKDFHFKEARKLAIKYRQIKFDDLNIRCLVRNHCLAKSISDAGWGQFIMIVVHKAEEAGGQVIKVNPAYTSQKSSRCGDRHQMPLSIRVYRCSNCGLIIDRDHNIRRHSRQEQSLKIQLPEGHTRFRMSCGAAAKNRP